MVDVRAGSAKRRAGRAKRVDRLAGKRQGGGSFPRGDDFSGHARERRIGPAYDDSSPRGADSSIRMKSRKRTHV